MKNVLIVEDDPFTAELYKDKLETAGYGVEYADSRQNAIALLQDRRPDLVLLDLSLGQDNGVDVIRFARSQETTRDLPIVVLTNALMGRQVREAWDAGANNYLNKSGCSPVRLVETVRLMIQLFRNRKAKELRTAPGAAVPPVEIDPVELRKTIAQALRGHIEDSQRALDAWLDGELEGSEAHFIDLCNAVRGLTSYSTLAGFSKSSFVSSTFEEFLDVLRADSDQIDGSAVNTIRQTIDLLPKLVSDETIAPHSPTRAPHVLVVDDDPVAREVALGALERTGVAALGIDYPELATMICERNPFDVILLDIEMPGIDGFELCESIHKMPMNLRTPIVFVTARTDEETHNQFLMSGAADFINKPLRLTELALKTLVHLHRARLQISN